VITDKRPPENILKLIESNDIELIIAATDAKPANFVPES